MHPATRRLGCAVRHEFPAFAGLNDRGPIRTPRRNLSFPMPAKGVKTCIRDRTCAAYSLPEAQKSVAIYVGVHQGHAQRRAGMRARRINIPFLGGLELPKSPCIPATQGVRRSSQRKSTGFSGLKITQIKGTAVTLGATHVARWGRFNHQKTGLSTSPVDAELCVRRLSSFEGALQTQAPYEKRCPSGFDKISTGLRWRK